MNEIQPQGPIKHNVAMNWAVFAVVVLGVGSFLLSQINNFSRSSEDLGLYIRVAHAAGVATLALSPASTSVAQGSTFTVSINLDTGGAPADGVDIYQLHFNPAILQVVDSNSGVAGVQIAPTALLPNTAINTADNAAGTIQFSQSTTGGTSFTGSGSVATITFSAISAGTSAVTFDFTAGSTADTNVAYQGVDQLNAVTNGSFTVTPPDATPPTVSITAPTGGSTVSGSTTTVSANASDNVGVVGVQFKLDGANLGSEDTTSPYSVVWNTTTASNASHTLTAVARDAAGNTTTSSSVSVTVNNAAFDFTLTNGGNKSVTQGSNVTNTITATLSSGTTTAVSFAASGLPTGVSAAFSPTTCSPTCTSTLTLTATGSATVGVTTTTVTVNAGATSHTTTFSLTVNSATFARTITLTALEARSSKIITGTLNAYNSSKVLLKAYSFTTDASGNATINFDIPVQTAFLQVKATPYLTREISQDLSVNTAYSFSQLLIGDINQDNIINSVDYSILNTNWFTSTASADLNQDGLVNSIDYSFMNKHWLLTGEQ